MDERRIATNPRRKRWSQAGWMPIADGHNLRMALRRIGAGQDGQGGVEPDTIERYLVVEVLPRCKYAEASSYRTRRELLQALNDPQRNWRIGAIYDLDEQRAIEWREHVELLDP